MPQVHLNELPPDGRDYSGKISPEAFGRGEESDPHVVSPVEYDLNVRLDKDLIVIEGRMAADFELECSRCLERFPWRVELSAYFSEEPREGLAILDLTALIREDILLALPGYPHCEDSNVSPRTCPAADRFAPASKYVPISEEEASQPRSRDVWKILDEVKERIDDEDQP